VTLKTIGTPLDRPDLDAWRDRLAAVIGVAYSGLSTTAKTQIDRIRDEAIEYISQRAAHQPWGIAEDASDVVDAGTDTTYPFPADVRHVIAITEETSTDSFRCKTSDKADYLDAWGEGSDSHPWKNRSVPVWFFDGWTSDKPPKQQWRRLGADNTGATIRIFYRPFFGLVTSTGTDQYVQLPASEVMAIESQALYKWALFTGDEQKVNMYQRAREDDIAALEINDRVTSEDPIQQGVGESFASQVGD